MRARRGGGIGEIREAEARFVLLLSLSPSRARARAPRSPPQKVRYARVAPGLRPAAAGGGGDDLGAAGALLVRYEGVPVFGADAISFDVIGVLRGDGHVRARAGSLPSASPAPPHPPPATARALCFG